MVPLAQITHRLPSNLTLATKISSLIRTHQAMVMSSVAHYFARMTRIDCDQPQVTLERAKGLEPSTFSLGS